jgi:hypothetical protein
MLNDRQLCLLSNSAIEFKTLIEKIVSKQVSKLELMEALSEFEAVTSCIRMELDHGFDIIEIESQIAN